MIPNMARYTLALQIRASYSCWERVYVPPSVGYNEKSTNAIDPLSFALRLPVGVGMTSQQSLINKWTKIMHPSAGYNGKATN